MGKKSAKQETIEGVEETPVAARKKRIYVVMVKEEPHMVRAATAAQATARATRGIVSARPANVEDVLRMSKDGVEVIDCDDESEE